MPRRVEEGRMQTANEILRTLIRESGLTGDQIAKMLGYPDGRYIGAKLNIKNMTTQAVAEIAEALGYELVLQPKTSGRRKEGQHVIEIEKGKGESK